MQLLNDWKLIILGCLTLGLAPFSPEPYLQGKAKMDCRRRFWDVVYGFPSVVDLLFISEINSKETAKLASCLTA